MFGWVGVVITLVFVIVIPGILFRGLFKAFKPKNMSGNIYAVPCLSIATILYLVFLFNEGPGELFMSRLEGGDSSSSVPIGRGLLYNPLLCPFWKTIFFPEMLIVLVFRWTLLKLSFPSLRTVLTRR